MELTAMAEMLNSVFYNFDYVMLNALHNFAELTGGFFTPIFSLISFLGENGIAMFLLAFILMLFRKARMSGVCIFGAVCCGALITNILLKDMIARPRPFMDSIYYEWWQFVGATPEDGWSFPSGHVTAIMSAMTAVFLSFDKRKSWIGFILVVVMGISRNYLMVHYPSDVLGAVLVGLMSGVVAWRIAYWIFVYLKKHRQNRVFSLVMEFDIRNVLGNIFSFYRP